MVVGYRADDSYFSFAQDFITGTISLAQFGQAMHLGKLGEQIVLKGRRAFDRLSFLTYDEADAGEYFLKKTQRDREARREYRRLSAIDAGVDDIYMIDIMRGGMKGNDVRLR